MARKPTVNPDLFAKTETGEQADPQASKHTLGPVALPESGSRAAVSYYFDDSTSLALAEGKVKLQGIAPAGRRSGITKSAIVELAVLAVLADLDAHGGDSWLAERFLRDADVCGMNNTAG
jgi:hypothetical protein